MFEELFSEPGGRPGISGGKVVGRDLGTVTAPIHTPRPKEMATSWSYFHPNRASVRFAPDEFRARVHQIDPNLEVTWHAIYERWCVWVRNPRITHRMCPGWQMLFPVRTGDGSFMPLDDRTLAMIYDRSPRKWGNARVYFDRILDEMRHDLKARQQAHSAVVGQNARDHWDYAQIKVGYGPSNGSKFTQHHSGN